MKRQWYRAVFHRWSLVALALILGRFPANGSNFFNSLTDFTVQGNMIIAYDKYPLQPSPCYYVYEVPPGSGQVMEPFPAMVRRTIPGKGESWKAVVYYSRGSEVLYETDFKNFRKVGPNGQPCEEEGAPERSAPRDLIPPTATIPLSHSGESGAPTPDSNFAVLAGSGNKGKPISLVDLKTNKEVSTLTLAGVGSDVAMCDDGSALVLMNGSQVNVSAIRRVTVKLPGSLVDSGLTFALAEANTGIRKIYSVAGSKVGVALTSRFGGSPAAFLVTFKLPEMTLLDSVQLSGINDLSAVVSRAGDRVYARNNDRLQGFTLDPVTGELGNAAVLTISDVSPAILPDNFGDTMSITPDGAHVLVSEKASPPTTGAPTPRVTFFDSASGARIDALTGSIFTAPGRIGSVPSSFVFPVLMEHTVVLEKGDPAPGAGLTDGPPADALLATFTAPALDDDGNVAFTAGWTSVAGPVKKGTGLFTANRCVATIGGPVNGVAGAVFTAFSSPLISANHVVFLGTLKGVPSGTNKAVMSDLGGSLGSVARLGDLAPDTGGMKFKAFDALAIDGAVVGFLGKVTGPSAEDVGLWAQDGTHPLTLLLRENQTVAGRTIKTLVSFKVGNGSPGQGRGWISAGANGAQAFALVTFTDKTTGLVQAGIDGTKTLLSVTGLTGPGLPDIADASFTSYSVPSVTPDGHTAFLGTLKTGAGGVTSKNARGIVADLGGANLVPLARLGETAGATGGTYSAFKDPVLAADGGLAFAATLTGPPKGNERNTVWFFPLNGGLMLLAQGAKPPPGLDPAAQWKTFTSLGIPNGQGPTFIATLLAGKGGVKSTNSTGVWRSDAAGNVYLAFCTGDLIEDKTVKSFLLMNALPGLLGSTRSFNSAGQIAWLATFVEKSTGIVLSTPPVEER